MFYYNWNFSEFALYTIYLLKTNSFIRYHPLLFLLAIVNCSLLKRSAFAFYILYSSTRLGCHGTSTRASFQPQMFWQENLWANISSFYKSNPSRYRCPGWRASGYSYSAAGLSSPWQDVSCSLSYQSAYSMALIIIISWQCQESPRSF